MDSQTAKIERKNFFSGSRLNVMIAVIAALAVIVAGYYLLIGNAAGFFAAAEPDRGTIATNAKIVTDASASDGKAVQFTAPVTPPPPPPPPPPPTGTTKCPLPKYPSASCTGVPAGTALSAHSGDYVASKAGEVISGKKISGSLIVNAHDVVIKNSEINGQVVNDQGSTRYRFTIEDSTIGLTSGCGSISNGMVGVANFTARRLRIMGQPDGFRVAGSNVLIEDSYVTVCSKNPSDHSDGLQVYGAAGATNITIRHNVIDQRSVTNGAATAPIFIPTDADRQGNNGVTVNVMDNVVAGGGFGLRIFGTLPLNAQTVTGNKVVNNTWEYGPVDVSCDKIGTWSGNAVVTFDFNTGQILSQVRPLNDCN